MIFTLTFWRAALARALRTVLVAALPFLAPLVTMPSADTFRQAGLALAFAAILSLATSLASLPEVGGHRGPWAALLDRTARTFAQTLAAALAAAAVWSDIDWPTLLAQALVAALTTALLALVEQLPETGPVVRVEPDLDGVYAITSLTPDERAVVNDLRAIKGQDPLPRTGD